MYTVYINAASIKNNFDKKAKLNVKKSEPNRRKTAKNLLLHEKKVEMKTFIFCNEKL